MFRSVRSKTSSSVQVAGIGATRPLFTGRARRFQRWRTAGSFLPDFDPFGGNEVFLDWLEKVREELLKSGDAGDDRPDCPILQDLGGKA